MFVVGADGCKTGWVVALLDLETGATSVRTVPAFADLLTLPEAPSVIAVDIPIGLLDAAIAGGRECEGLARGLLGHPRSSSVFSPPVRPSLAATTFARACARNRASSAAGVGISQQTFGLFTKLREVEAAMTPAHQARVYEVHPELCFYEMAKQRPAKHGKKSAAGRVERTKLLAAAGLRLPAAPLRGAAMDDVVDALVACWTARRIHAGTALRLPPEARVDSRGLRMEIWR